MITKKMFLQFPKCETEKPIVYHLVKDYDLIINIFRAKVTPDQEGYLVLDVSGEPEAIERGMDYVKSFGVIINSVESGILIDEKLCTHCGNCVSHCPSQALHIPDRKSMRVVFEQALCISCTHCISNCPFGACSSIF